MNNCEAWNPSLSDNPTLWIYTGRVGHDVSEGFCSCGGYHRAEDNIRAGTKTVLVQVNGENRTIEWIEPEGARFLNEQN